jgi:hypothetical protein
MSNVIGAPFFIERTTDGRWAVHMDGSVEVVQTHGEAKLLSRLPIEHSKTFTDGAEKPDKELVHQILDICKNYHITSVGIRRLESWLAG